jgi:glycosyltransferase involved in cell wall biosynthesis
VSVLHDRETDRDRDSEGLPRVLAVTTTFRAAEVTGPMAYVPGETVVLDADASALDRIVEAARETRRAIRRTDPDVLLLNGAGLSGFVVALVAWRYGVPLVARLVGDPAAVSDTEGVARAQRRGPLAVAVEYAYVYLSRAVFALATGFVAVSTDLAARTRERTGLAADRVQTVPVPLNRDPQGDPERVRDSFGVDDPTVVLTVTNLDFRGKYRGVLDTLAGLEPLLSAREDLVYVVAGDGAYREDLVAAVDERFGDSPARERVHLPGYVDGVFDYVAAADVFCYCSYIDGYPNAVLEAQSMGRPVVANPAFGMLDMVRDGETGLLVDPEDPTSVRDAVAGLLDDPAERRRLGRAARRRVTEENDPEVVGRRLHDALGAVLAAAARER